MTTKKTSSTLAYRWLKPLKDEPTPDTTYGSIYAAIRKIKQGTLDDLTKAAIKAGLTKHSKQEPRAMTRLFLRTLVNLGSVAQSRADEGTKSVKKPTTRVKLVAQE